MSQMKPARRTKGGQMKPQETVDLSNYQPAGSPSAKRTPSSPPPTRIGHPRSYLSPPAKSAIGNKGIGISSGNAAAADDIDDFDFAFDKMATSEEDDQEGNADVVQKAIKKPTKKKQAVAGSGSGSGSGKAATPLARKPKEAVRGSTGKSSGTAASKNATAKVPKSTVRADRSASAKKVASVRALEDTDDDVDDDDDEKKGSSGSSSPQEEDDSDWEFDGAGGSSARRGKVGKIVGNGRPTAGVKSKGRVRGSREANGAVGPSRGREDTRRDSAGGKKQQSVHASSSSKGDRDDVVGVMDEGSGPDESDEEEKFLVDGKLDERGGTGAALRGRVKDRSRDLGIDLTGNDDDDDNDASASPSTETTQLRPASKVKKTDPAEKRSAAATAAPAAAASTSPTTGEKRKVKSKDMGKGKGKARKNDVLSTAKPVKLASDVEVVLRRLRRLSEDTRRGGGGAASKRVSDSGGVDGSEEDWDGKKAQTLMELGLGGNVTEVREMNSAGVMDEIERIIVETALAIMGGKGFGFRVPTRSSGNQKYVEELDRIVLGDKVSQRNFVSTAMARKTAITTRVIQLVHQVLGKGIHITKRDMFYTDVKLFRDQGESDSVLDDVACMVGCTRSCLNVVASDKGLVVGRVTFREDGDMIDCTRMGVGGKAIPPYIDKITEVKSDADFILLVEKEAAYMRLAEDRFYQKYPCIVITAKGQPDVATRLFLKRLKRELNIPVMGLVDSDPYGLKILSVYMSGSKNMSYDSASLTTPDIKWLGVRPSDLDRYNIPEQCRLDMTDHDIKTGKELLQEDFIKKSDPWCRELELMIKSKKKAEIQSLSAFGFQYLTHTYLPQKLQNGDWV